jgi:hypothetical protein
MKKAIFFLLICILYACNGIQPKAPVQHQTTWVYLESEKIMKSDTTNYYLYGKIRSSVLEKIHADEKINGLFQLKEIRFVNTDDLLEIYEDEDQIGRIFLNIQDIKYISVYKRDPIYSFEEKDLHESLKKMRSK